MDSPVETIKARLSIIDVVGSYIKLDKAGSTWKARCPFHNERTPSFVVSPTRDNFHCFGCGKAGDIFTFVEEMEGVTFKEALEILATKAGVVLDRTVSKKVSDVKRLYQAMESAVSFYQSNLKEQPEAIKYLKGRGINDKTIQSFRIGYAPNEWSTLSKHLAGLGFSEDEMKRAGLSIEGGKGLYDRFRGRIMFPINNTQGAPVAFSGRIDPRETGDNAKYVNSPETELYNKSRILYGYDRAKRSLLKSDHCIIVEGQMDLILAHQAGSTNTVAVSGTAFTEYHADLIRRFTSNIKICFDGDKAGFTAFERAVRLLVDKGCVVKVVSLPDGTDPADLILRNPDEWVAALRASSDIVSFYSERLAHLYPDRGQFVGAIESRLLPVVALVRSPLIQDHMIKEITERSGLTEGAVREGVSRATREAIGEKYAEEKNTSHIGDSARIAERRTLGFIIWLRGASIAIPDTIINRFSDLAKSSESEIFGRYSEAEQSSLAFEAEMYYSHHSDPLRILEELVDSYEQFVCESELGQCLSDLKKAENSGTMNGIDALVLRCHELTSRINSLKSKHQ